MAIQKEKFDNFVKYVKKSFEEITLEIADAQYSYLNEKRLFEDTKVALIIGISGNSKGRILLECSYETAYNFAIAMNCEDPLDDPKDMYSYLAEFANMFCGRATTYANNEYKDREFWLAPPCIFSAKGLEIITPSIQSEIVYLEGKQGVFLIDIGFES